MDYQSEIWNVMYRYFRSEWSQIVSLHSDFPAKEINSTWGANIRFDDGQSDKIQIAFAFSIQTPDLGVGYLLVFGFDRLHQTDFPVGYHVLEIL